MNYQKLIDGMKRFGSTEDDICVHGLGVTADKIKENVIIAPWWEPNVFADLGEAEFLSLSEHASHKIWNIEYNGLEMTYIKTGIGAPQFMDSMLTLGVTGCKRIIFIGSAGALDESFGIGDIVIPEFSICGDGASRYIASDDLSADPFGEKTYPDMKLFTQAKEQTERICCENNVRCHIGRTFSIDTIFAQYAHIDTILNTGCNVIEMETSSAFRAGTLMNVPTAAIFSVSDNTVINKSLVSGRSEEEMDYRKFVRSKLFPQIIHAVFEHNLT